MQTENQNSQHLISGRIAGVSVVVPRTRMLNEDMLPRFGAIESAKVTGIRSRHLAQEDETSEILCVQAARWLMTDVGWNPRSVDALVYVTQTPSRLVPSTIYDMAKEIGLKQGCFVMELNWSCAGYVLGLMTAMNLLQTCERVLFLNGDVTSKIALEGGRAVAPVFGDAGSATAIERPFFPGHANWFIHGQDGENSSALCQYSGQPLFMDGASVMNFALKRVPPLVNDLLTINPKPDMLLFHQANKLILDYLKRKCKLEDRGFAPEDVPINLDQWGNCSSVSIPLLLVDSLTKRTRRTMRLGLIGFGAGFAWAAVNVLLDADAPLSLVVNT